MSRALALLTLLVSFTAVAKPPKLVLLITVDALGSDVLLRGRPRLKGGLAQLVNQGAFFPYARYEYTKTVTAAGHATLSTGANPWRHGLVSNRIINRATGREEAILADAAHPPLEAPPSGDDVSPENLLAETLADRLRLATVERAKAVALAVKPRAAIALAGRLGQAYWLHDELGKVVTGTYYMKELPPWVKAFNEKTAGTALFGKEWTLTAKPGEYLGVDDRPFEADWEGLGRTFPKKVTGGLAAPGPEFYGALATTPMMNDVLVQLAKAALDGEGLGKDDVPDLLAVSFSSFDIVYHAYGPTSWELQDALLKLDRTLGDLLLVAERAAGKGNVLVVLSADHGGADVPEAYAALGLPAARVSPSALEAGLRKELQAKFGAELVAGVEGQDLYLSSKVIADRKLDGAAVRRAAAAWLLRQPQVNAAVTREEVEAGSPVGIFGRAFRLGYYPERSGDVMFVVKPFHVVTDAPNAGTSHGTPYSYDAQVPVVFWGKGVRTGTHRTEISPTDVAPTLSAFLEIGTPALAEGQIRAEVFGGGK